MTDSSFDRWFEKAFVVFLGTIGLAIVVLVVGCTVSATTTATCRAKGWRDGAITWNLHRFCVTRIDQTDVVVPIGEAEQR